MTEATQDPAPVEDKTITRSAVIVNKQGLHARPAADFVNITNRYKECEIQVKTDELTVNGKSLMNILILAAGPGTTLTFIASGKDCETMLDELCELVESGFGEELVD